MMVAFEEFPKTHSSQPAQPRPSGVSRPAAAQLSFWEAPPTSDFQSHTPVWPARQPPGPAHLAVGAVLTVLSHRLTLLPLTSPLVAVTAATGVVQLVLRLRLPILSRPVKVDLSFFMARQVVDRALDLVAYLFVITNAHLAKENIED